MLQCLDIKLSMLCMIPSSRRSGKINTVPYVLVKTINDLTNKIAGMDIVHIIDLKYQQFSISSHNGNRIF